MTQPARRIAPRRSLRDEVFDALMERIAGGVVRPGEPLGIDSLAAELGVSPTPVREALVQLEATGLVIRTALRGYRVAPPLSVDGFKELFDARRIVEVNAARLAAENVDQLLPVLRERHATHVAHGQRLQAVQGDARSAALSDYLAADWNFHQAILDAAGNRFLLQMAQHISTHGHRLRQFIGSQHTDEDAAVAEHRAILDAFETRDADAVARAMTHHIDSVRARVLKHPTI